MYYEISASVETTDGTWTSCKALPTFYLHSHVQGILTSSAAESVARDILASVAPIGAVLHVHASIVQA